MRAYTVLEPKGWSFLIGTQNAHSDHKHALGSAHVILSHPFVMGP